MAHAFVELRIIVEVPACVVEVTVQKDKNIEEFVEARSDNVQCVLLVGLGLDAACDDLEF